MESEGRSREEVIAMSSHPCLVRRGGGVERGGEGRTAMSAHLCGLWPGE